MADYVTNHLFLKGQICSTEQSSSSFLQNVHFSVHCKKPGSETTKTTISEREICEDLNFMEAKKFPNKTIESAKKFLYFPGMTIGRHLHMLMIKLDTLDSGINIGVRLLIFRIFSMGYVLIKHTVYEKFIKSFILGGTGLNGNKLK